MTKFGLDTSDDCPNNDLNMATDLENNGTAPNNEAPFVVPIMRLFEEAAIIPVRVAPFVL